VALPAPILDDRSYQQLRDELVRRIPVYAPEWTDHNASDPGIALLELFASLGETLLYRFNQIPESTYLAYLRLLDVPLQPPGVARALVAFTTKRPDGDLVPGPSALTAGAVDFESLTEVTAWPLSARAVCRAASAPPDDPDALEWAQQAVDALDLGAGEEAVYYVDKLTPADPSAPDAAPVDFSQAVDATVWIAVLAEDGADPKQLGGATLNIGFVPDEAPGTIAAQDPCPGIDSRTPAPPVVWQVSTGEVDSTGTPKYRTIELVADTTRGLTQQGVLRLRLPPKDDPLGVFPPGDPELAGTGEQPPALEDDAITAKLLFWLRAFRPDGGGFGSVLWVGTNAAEVEQARRAEPEFVGTGSGGADQRFTVVHAPVIPGTLGLEVEEADGWRPWSLVDAFDASGEDDRHVVLDPVGGELRFGNGVRGRAPQIGQRIRTTGYRYGGGAEGNVPAGAINAISAHPGITLKNPLSARGGGPAEAIADALERIPGELRRRDRAVTAGDFRELALATPGADLGRAECLPLFHPRHLELEEAAGVVSVVVWPREDRLHPNAPVPDRTVLRAVCAQLDARRLVTTEVYVIPPTYQKVAVAVGLAVKPGYGVDAVRRWVELVLRQYLAPLPPFGPSGTGWPLGRRVHGPELQAAALQVEGVEFLEGLDVAGLADDGVTWVPGTVTLERYQVVELAAITVVEGQPLAPGEGLEPAPSAQRPVPVPVIRETC
jgi:hypothetical protein